MSQVIALKAYFGATRTVDVSTLCNRNSTSLMTDLSNVIHCFWQSCAVANHTAATGEHTHVLKATDWTSASQPTLKTDDSYLAFSNYDFKLIERNDKRILVGVVELMGMLQWWELLELVYENNIKLISIFYMFILYNKYTVPLYYYKHSSICKTFKSKVLMHNQAFFSVLSLHLCGRVFV